MISARPRILIKVTFLKHFELEVWVSILTLCILEIPNRVLFANSENPDSTAFQQGLHCLLRQNRSSEKNNQYIWKLKPTCTSSIPYKSRHETSNNVVCATSKASDQPAYTRSLIRVFASRLAILTEHHLEFLSLKKGCAGSSESTHVKIPHCWKSHPDFIVCSFV